MKRLFTLVSVVALLGNVASAQSYVLDFDGVDDYVDVGNDVGDGIRTIELWFMPTNNIDNTLSEAVSLVMRNTTGCNECEELGIVISPSAWYMPGAVRFISYQTAGAEGNVYSDANSWNANQWYHVAAVIHPQDGIAMYIDGVKQAYTDTMTSASAISNNITAIGTWGDAYIRNFDGRIEDVRFSTDAVYSNNFTPSCPNISALPNSQGVWRFNEGTGSIALDSSGNGYDGTIYGATYVVDSICGSVGVNENHYNSGIKIFPNPTEGQFTVSSGQLAQTIEVIDLFGRIVLTTANPEIDMWSYAKGVYFVRVGETVQKLILE